MTTKIPEVMAGLVMIEQVMSDKMSGDATAMLLVGKFDHQIKAALYFSLTRKTRKTPDDDAEMETEQVIRGVARLKDVARLNVTRWVEAAGAIDHARLVEQLKKTNQPHEMGTVAEIAAKYSISKSEVRRRKADGTLDQLTLPPERRDN